MVDKNYFIIYNESAVVILETILSIKNLYNETVTTFYVEVDRRMGK
jgi:hypothetical protein